MGVAGWRVEGISTVGGGVSLWGELGGGWIGVGGWIAVSSVSAGASSGRSWVEGGIGLEGGLGVAALVLGSPCGSS